LFVLSSFLSPFLPLSRSYIYLLSPVFPFLSFVPPIIILFLIYCFSYPFRTIVSFPPKHAAAEKREKWDLRFSWRWGGWCSGFWHRVDSQVDLYLPSLHSAEIQKIIVIINEKMMHATCWRYLNVFRDVCVRLNRAQVIMKVWNCFIFVSIVHCMRCSQQHFVWLVVIILIYILSYIKIET
jgi:hypothetical protein